MQIDNSPRKHDSKEIWKRQGIFIIFLITKFIHNLKQKSEKFRFKNLGNKRI